MMLHQEDCFYKTEDYLAPHFQQQLSAISASPFFLSSSGSHSSSKSSSSTSSINEIWREKICEWAYQVIDHFDYSREVVGVAIHYLDRYLATRTVNKKLFQLAAMTSLFLAIKLYEPGKISMASMIELSRGYFSVDQMIAMEASILRSVIILALRTLKFHRMISRTDGAETKRQRLCTEHNHSTQFLHYGAICSDVDVTCAAFEAVMIRGFGMSYLLSIFSLHFGDFQLAFSPASFALVSTFLRANTIF